MSDSSEASKDVIRAKWYDVNRKLLPVKMFYFFTLAGMGCLYPFVTLYMKHVGLTSREVGIIYGMMPFIGYLVRPIIGNLADRIQKHKLILITCCLLNGVFHLLLLLVPEKGIYKHSVKMKTIIHCNQFNSYIHDCIPKHFENDVHCPTLFTNYVQIDFKKYRTAKLTSLDGKMDTGNFWPSFSWMESHGIKCSLDCKTGSGNSKPEVGFCGSPGNKQQQQRCKDYVLNLNHNDNLGISLSQIYLSLRKDTSGEVIIEKDTNCANFLLSNLTYNSDSYFNMNCAVDMELSCNVTCTDVTNQPCLHMEKIDTGEMTLTFWLFLLLFFLGNVSEAPILGLGDAITQNILGGEKRNLWGKQKLWGTLGFAVFAVTSAILVDLLSTDTSTNYNFSFYIFVFLLTVAAAVSCLLPIDRNILCINFSRNLSVFLDHPNIVMFLLALTCLGFMLGACETFLFWYLQDHLGNTLLIVPGATLLISCMVETVFLFASGPIILKLGHLNCIYLGFVSFGIRFLCYSFLTNAWQILAVEILYGLNMGLVLAAATSYSSILAPPGTAPTLQAVIRGCHFGCGKGLGSVLTGLLYPDHVLGMVWTFRLYGVLSFSCLFLYLTFNKVWLERRKRLQKGKNSMHTIEEDLDENVTSPTNVNKSLLENSVNSQSEEGIKSLMLTSVTNHTDENRRTRDFPWQSDDDNFANITSENDNSQRL
ncbi:major facilitator superfamily domain-containing protein 6-like protein A isoform X1 [Mizuhopecten yessoensis]|uniref:Major facilitator superfamily domain-containing protein 6-B n=1 Tax=Mizuhopecten yessoensis TaxID=6573 RepID=A0A210R1J2_MIZYE|nr:major facilitator superfamily domain-containing protein 6-like protein A isoform X1 [Mizuhopecten yessoensis]XP_021378356.1 major facilitator superfamily domain-containing protein 6-like protein A isoform X1 [Mizuhopecten yessoensis]OWF54933.1 Major facilitator superfamily domain-containing protein 6-B [Mizuhopecten yessoensis]